MRKILVLLLLTSLYNLAAAQSTSFRVSGKTTSKNKGIENISFSLLRVADSSVIKMAISDNEGKFEFTNVPAGSYLLTASSVNYNKYVSPALLVSHDVEVAHIDLQPLSKVVGDVTVTSRRPPVEMKADKLVVNVDASPSNAGNTALDVLEKSPGVTVDKDGNISLKGKQGVMILIDGKPAYGGGADLANLLKGMTAAQLDQIEIMTNPPAKYDASGNSGIINIKTKKSKTVGFNGSMNAGYGQGVYAKTNSGLNLNYRRNKFNVFGSANYSYRGGYQQFSVNRNVMNLQTNTTAFRFEQEAYMPDTRNTITSKIGLDYDVSKKTSASVLFSTFDTRMTYDNNTNNKIYTAAGELQTINYGRTYMTPHVKNYSGNFNLTHKFDSAGTEGAFNADYIQFTDKHRQSFYNSFYNNQNVLLKKADTLKGFLPTGYDVYAAKVDFTKPMGNNRKLEFGAKMSYVSSDNNIQFDSIINGNIVLDTRRTNHFLYKESIVAGYVNYNTPLSKKLSVQAGLRYEYTDGRGNSITNKSTFTNRYGQLFPTLYLSYTANDKNTLNLNYGRRVTRPQYRDMNPFIFIIDQYTYQKGNPNLQPQFGHNIELSHNYQNALMTTLNYSQVDGAISEVVETNEVTKEAALIKKNIATKQQLGLAINFNKSLNKMITTTVNVNTYYNKYKGVVNDTSIDFSGVSGNFYAALQFKFKKGWDAEINGFFNSRSVDGVSLSGTMGMMSFATSKSILNNKGKITLNVRDPFAWQRYTGTTKFSTVDATINTRWDNRVINLAFNYRFGKTFKTRARSNGSAAEEQSRIGG
jgi:iron complex outermembrane recepter protein